MFFQMAGADRSQDRQPFKGMLAAEAAKANHCQGSAGCKPLEAEPPSSRGTWKVQGVISPGVL